MKKLYLFIIIILTSLNLKSEDLSFTNQLNLIDNTKIESLSKKITLIDAHITCSKYKTLFENLCKSIESTSKPDQEATYNYHLEIFTDLFAFELKNKTGCRIMWGYDLPLSKKEEYCNTKTINDLGEYKNVAFINNNDLLNDMFTSGGKRDDHKNVDKLKRSLEVVKTNIIKKLKKLKNKKKILGSMAYFEVLVSEITKIPYYKTESLNELLLARDVFRGILNIPINASSEHAAYYFFWHYNSHSVCSGFESSYIDCHISATQIKDNSLRKFILYMGLKSDFKLVESFIAHLQENEQTTLKKETESITKELIDLKDNIDSNMEKNLNQVSKNLENITKNSREVFSAFDHWGDLGPTIDLGNGRGLNLLTGRVGRFKRFGE